MLLANLQYFSSTTFYWHPHLLMTPVLNSSTHSNILTYQQSSDLHHLAISYELVREWFKNQINYFRGIFREGGTPLTIHKVSKAKNLGSECLRLYTTKAKHITASTPKKTTIILQGESKKRPPQFILNISSYKHARKLRHNSLDK